ncbi:uncharacterized protein LY89DRAFT_676729 [Mollisia scopiformis]|uniref:Uncharacterized protein n=1 Tax=Mollisia scopiformis TaxID=149040 RepID=A0A132B8W0_MOLSC|nr:uncharacterized protein LY89DRAFT_676729 [Mollisia scopiformis]KUJ08836.1 hypothetical protein LY89DRAFT_676729 [Mollisia scopiformis]
MAVLQRAQVSSIMKARMRARSRKLTTRQRSMDDFGLQFSTWINTHANGKADQCGRSRFMEEKPQLAKVIQRTKRNDTTELPERQQGNTPTSSPKLDIVYLSTDLCPGGDHYSRSVITGSTAAERIIQCTSNLQASWSWLSIENVTMPGRYTNYVLEVVSTSLRSPPEEQGEKEQTKTQYLRTEVPYQNRKCNHPSVHFQITSANLPTSDHHGRRVIYSVYTDMIADGEHISEMHDPSISKPP